MTQLATKIWTYEEYLALPDDGNRYEIIEGELYVTPAPNTDHQHISSELHFLLKEFVRRNQLGVVYYAPYEVHLSETTRPVQPDLLFIRTENEPKGGTPYFVGVPDLVIEILSKSSIRTDNNSKFNAYEKAGIPEYWIVDPKAHTVRVFVLEEGIYQVWGEYSGDEVITSKVLAGLKIVNSALFKA
jgi:Uma2 family endonuclease